MALRTIVTLSADAAKLDLLLENAAYQAKVLEFAKKHLVTEITAFMMAVNAYKKLARQNALNLPASAVAIFKEYVKPGSAKENNLPAPEIAFLTAAVAVPAQCTATLFDNAFNICSNELAKGAVWVDAKKEFAAQLR